MLSDNFLTYEFVNAFPKGMTSMPVKYGAAELLKVSVQFAYDRYVVNHGQKCKTSKFIINNHN